MSLINHHSSTLQASQPLKYRSNIPQQVNSFPDTAIQQTNHHQPPAHTHTTRKPKCLHARLDASHLPSKPRLARPSPTRLPSLLAAPTSTSACYTFLQNHFCNTTHPRHRAQHGSDVSPQPETRVTDLCCDAIVSSVSSMALSHARLEWGVEKAVCKELVVRL